MSVRGCLLLACGFAVTLASLPSTVLASVEVPIDNEVVPEASSVIIWLGILSVGALATRRAGGRNS